MTFTVDGLVEFNLKKVAEAEARLALLRESVVKETAILKNLPATLCAELKSIRLQEAYRYAPAELEFKVTSRQQALELFKELGSVPLLMFSGGVTTFTPEVLSPESSPPGTPIAPLVYRISTWIQSAKEEYFWWTYVGNQLTEIRAICDPAVDTKVSAAHTYNNSAINGRSANLQWQYDGLPKGMHTFWYGGDVSRMTPVTIHLGREVDVCEAYAQSMSLQYRQANVAQCSC